MSDTSNSPATHFRASGILVGIGVVLLGVAAVLIAAQWETHTTFTIDTPAPQGSEHQKVGFALISAKEDKADQFADPEYAYYLLDKDSGRVWAKSTYDNSWKELDVEGITPSKK